MNHNTSIQTASSKMKLSSALIIPSAAACILYEIPLSLAFTSLSISNAKAFRKLAHKTRKIRLNQMRNDNGDEITVDGLDWRAFRAQLIMNDNEPSRKSNPSKLSQWAYDQGDVVEQGSIILGGVEQDYGFGLRQRYFHKCAMLVIDHNSKFTKGVILNRKSAFFVTDKDGNRWNIWFGGGNQNLDHSVAEILCFHSMQGQNTLIDEISTDVVKGMQYCTFEKAQMLVEANYAKVDDFYCFAGNTMWRKGQLYHELQNNSWVMCATDSDTIWKEINRISNGNNQADAGTAMWEALMGMIGRGDTALECSGEFEDQMLKEWTKDNLSGDAQTNKTPLEDKNYANDSTKSNADKIYVNNPVGCLVRASSDERSPYLLNDQVFHKALVLMILENEEASFGMILNQPSRIEIELELEDSNTGSGKTVTFPVRFGGPHAQDKGVLFLHTNPTLREAKLGTPVGHSSGFWKCTQEEATLAMNFGLVGPEEFLVVSGLSAWSKDVTNEPCSGMAGELQKGNFEVADADEIPGICAELSKQRVLTWNNMRHNLSHGNNAWKRASGIKNQILEHRKDMYSSANNKTENTQSEQRGMAKLSDDALKTWVATFLLGSPSLGA